MFGKTDQRICRIKESKRTSSTNIDEIYKNI